MSSEARDIVARLALAIWDAPDPTSDDPVFCYDDKHHQVICGLFEAITRAEEANG